MADRMSAAKQVLQALKIPHDANIVHRGPFTTPHSSLVSLGLHSIDLSDINIMCGMTPLDTYDVKTKY